ncbi:MAG: hypothetical protein R3F43_04980 [bacterium]
MFRHLVAEAGLAAHFQIASAGTGGWHAGEAPDPRSTAVARKNGVDITPSGRGLAAVHRLL